MCKYRVTIKPGTLPPQDVVFYAKGMAEAIAKADGWAATHYPEEWCEFTTHRTQQAIVVQVFPEGVGVELAEDTEYLSFEQYYRWGSRYFPK
jgi:hypothetical protein